MGTGGYSYWWWDDWGLGWDGVDGAGAASASTRSLDLVVFGVAAIGVIKCYYDAYRCALPASRPRSEASDTGEVLAIERPSAFSLSDCRRFVREFVRQRLGRISNEVLGLPQQENAAAN